MTAAITVEELKKLVRQWKLHEVRGFWKTHPEKEDLIRALLNHMDDQNDLYNYESRLPTRPMKGPLPGERKVRISFSGFFFTRRTTV